MKGRDRGTPPHPTHPHRPSNSRTAPSVSSPYTLNRPIPPSGYTSSRRCVATTPPPPTGKRCTASGWRRVRGRISNHSPFEASSRTEIRAQPAELPLRHPVSISSARSAARPASR
ncbi:hypothetical protein GCM10010357_08040 [Streptomyces luteireticuli]|uniref:Uncharacterized protein n=1 Tax=Streptomyces luteireticuli TaxID=173858 RepID=A0ABP3I4D3_9ACTN